MSASYTSSTAAMCAKGCRQAHASSQIGFRRSFSTRTRVRVEILAEKSETLSAPTSSVLHPSYGSFCSTSWTPEHPHARRGEYPPALRFCAGSLQSGFYFVRSLNTISRIALDRAYFRCESLRKEYVVLLVDMLMEIRLEFRQSVEHDAVGVAGVNRWGEATGQRSQSA